MIGILWWLCEWMLYLVLGFLVWRLSFEVQSYLGIKRLEKQGAKALYVPFVGITKYLAGDPKDKDQMNMFRKLLEDNKDEDMITFNHPDKVKTLSFLLKDDLLREFFSKESEISNKFFVVDNFPFGFLLKPHAEARADRSIFTPFFSFENLKLVTEKANHIIFEGMLQIARELQNQSDWNTVDLKNKFKQLHYKTMNALLLGDIGMSESLADRFNTLVEHVNILMAVSMGNYWNLFFKGFLHRHNLLPTTRRANKLLPELSKIILDLYEKRRKEGPKADLNLLDLLIRHNEELIKQGKPPMPDADIVHHISAFKFGSEQTSMETILSGIVSIAHNPANVARIQKAVAEVCNGRKLDTVVPFADFYDNPEVLMFRREVLRKDGAAPFAGAWRKITKETKIGKYRFKPGDAIGYTCTLMSTISKHFDSPHVFDPDRMEPKKFQALKKSALVPYGMGIRTCIGKDMADLLIDVYLFNFFRVFDCAEDPNLRMDARWTVGYGLLHPTLKVKPRFN